MIPLFIDCSGRQVVIFGGGAVAARKAAYFTPEARVTVISRSFVQKLETLPVTKKTADVSELSDEKLAGLVSPAFLVIGALSDPAQNNRIGKICKKQKILFNNADGETGTVILPAKTAGTGYSLAISTGGSSPAISRFLREYIETALPELDAMIALQQRLREELKQREPDQARRTRVLHRVLEDPSVWKALKKDPETAWDRVAERYLHG